MSSVIIMTLDYQEEC